MPVEFLSDELAPRFGRFAGELTRDELERFFYVDPAIREMVDRHRRDHNRLGFALQVGTVRFLGSFLSSPLDAPLAAVEYLAGQLGIADASEGPTALFDQATSWPRSAKPRKCTTLVNSPLRRSRQRSSPLGQPSTGRSTAQARGEVPQPRRRPGRLRPTRLEHRSH